jgi:MFS family permease
VSDAARRIVGRMWAGARWPAHRVQEVQRRAVRTLVVSEALGGLGFSIGVAVSALLAEQVSGSEKLAGIPQTTQVLGAAISSWLLAQVMGRSGRRVGLTVGYLLGSAGAALCVVAGVLGSFALLLVAATLLGATTAANNQSRYAATDLAVPAARARALSVVVWATTIGAVAGPNLAGPADRPVGPSACRRSPARSCSRWSARWAPLRSSASSCVRTRFWSPGRRPSTGARRLRGLRRGGGSSRSRAPVRAWLPAPAHWLSRTP